MVIFMSTIVINIIVIILWFDVISACCESRKRIENNNVSIFYPELFCDYID